MPDNNLYTKKVIEHFQKPHNMGRIKNPDGVGKVGNLVCLLPGQQIHIKNDLKPIENLFSKEKVLSHDGNYHKIIRQEKRNYSGQILEIKNKLGTVKVTPDHLLLAIKIPQGAKFLGTKNRKQLLPAWYHAFQLKKGDIVLYPIPKKEKDLEYIKFRVPKPKQALKSKTLPEKIPINSDFLRLAGYFLAKGSINDKPCGTFISFTLNIKEKDIASDIKKISKKLFGLDAAIRKIPEKKTLIVELCSARLARFFEKKFMRGAKNKEIPEFIMNLPAGKQKSLLYGLWRGEGYINLNRICQRAGYTTISFKLAQQIKLLLLRQKISSYAFDDNYFYTPITDIKEKDYQGKVYNLEVSKSHSFVSDSFSLHNCGDVMWLYIKVGKNKKGKEIIKDIKFETYGCVAALATSSAITDLAKGKTLEEALEIKKDNIVKELGGLPPIKIHCSLLATDALSEAIYDYFQKQKRPIPEKLLKSHQRIEKEKKLIEEKYKDWVSVEEKMHNEKK